MDYTKLSKEVSYALRHAPREYELELDENGWVHIDQLIDSFKLEKKWNELTVDDLKKMIDLPGKKRHEILNDKIRALYGHSIPEKIKLEKKEPPEILFHGTARRFLENIKLNGLLPMNRQYVHLSTDKKTALIVGKRRDPKPVILKIHSEDAFKNGVGFYHGNDNIWLADKIEPGYIEI